MTTTTRRTSNRVADRTPGATRLDVRLHGLFDLLLRTASELDQQVAQLLKPAAVTPAQFNVLRILCESGDEGLSCGEMSERLVRHDPDVTRLLDRLEAQGFVARRRDTRDRRVVLAFITDAGVDLLDSLAASIAELHRRQFRSLTASDAGALAALLGVLHPENS